MAEAEAIQGDLEELVEVVLVVVEVMLRKVFIQLVVVVVVDIIQVQMTILVVPTVVQAS